MVKKNSWQELTPAIISAVVLGFVFGFNDKKEVFNTSYWLQNLVQYILISLIFIIIFIRITKWYSEKNGVTVKFNIWKIDRMGFEKSSRKKGIPVGIILPLLIAFMSYGKIFFSAVLMPEYESTKHSRFGKKFEMPTEGELGLISVIGPLTLALIGILLTASDIARISNLSLIPFSIAFSSMLPISRLNGTTAFFYSPTIYIFSITMIVLAYYLTKFTSPIGSIVFALLFSILVASAFYIKSFIITK
ncbi:MAG: hypothetical protein Q8Q42_04500 [Nanoarchaeota archaeon]|nr:hypothetical protein [Nanoarchaeota archaeon]